MICNYSNIIASNLGINAALIAGYIRYCISGKTEEKASVRLTQKDIAAVFPFMTVKAVRTATLKLDKAGICARKQNNKSKYDFTYFYSFTPYGKKISEGDADFV